MHNSGFVQPTFPFVPATDYLNDLETVAKKGMYYNPAYLHYGDANTNVCCDSCHRTQLIACIGYMRRDLCLPCAERINNKANLFNPNRIFSFGSTLGNSFSTDKPAFSFGSPFTIDKTKPTFSFNTASNEFASDS